MKVSKNRMPKVRSIVASASALSLLALSGCNTDDILKVTDPDLLDPIGLETPTGAVPLRYGVIRTFVDAFDGGVDSYAVVTGNMADELRASDTFDGRLLPNQRNANDVLPELNGVYLNLHKARTGANYAIKVIQRVAPTPKFNIGELYMYRAYTEDFLGEMYCSGMPFSDTDGDNITYGQQENTQQTFARAVASFDTAIANADTSKRVLYGASIGKARALLNNAQYAAAAAAVAGVPTTFKLNSDHCVGSGCTENGIWNAAVAPSSRYSLGNNEGINGVNFTPTVADPRVPWTQPTNPSRTGFSAQWTNQVNTLKVTRNGNNVLADGIEARLIEAEARLQGNTDADRAATLVILNNLRATGLTTVIPPLTQQTTQAAAVRQLFTERALWLYLTGHRLGDLRRLIRQYGFGAETVFPTGDQAAPVSGAYGSDVNFPIPASEKNNPNFKGCLNRGA